MTANYKAIYAESGAGPTIEGDSQRPRSDESRRIRWNEILNCYSERQLCLSKPAIQPVVARLAPAANRPASIRDSREPARARQLYRYDRSMRQNPPVALRVFDVFDRARLAPFSRTAVHSRISDPSEVEITHGQASATSSFSGQPNRFTAWVCIDWAEPCDTRRQPRP